MAGDAGGPAVDAAGTAGDMFMKSSSNKLKTSGVGGGFALLALIAGLAALILWSTEEPGGDGSERRTGPVVVVRGEVAARAGPAEREMETQDERSIARSEEAAARPPAGGPEVADTRSTPRAAAARFDGTTGKIESTGGYRLVTVSRALEADGFMEDDVVLGINSRPLDATIGLGGVEALLVPGAIVDVERGSEMLSWRLGPHPL